MLNGVVNELHGESAGNYQKAIGLKNDRSYWNQIDGDLDLWYDNRVTNTWIIGSSADLRSDIGRIASTQESACPTSNNQFLYNDYGDWTLSSNNSVSIQCLSTDDSKHLCFLGA